MKGIIMTAMLLPLIAQAEIIGFEEARVVPSYPQPTMDAIARTNWFFAHASVGVNMMNGLARLNASKPGFFKLIPDDGATNTPSDAAQVGRVYGYDRGNPGWKSKIELLDACVQNGWRAPKVGFVASKFCYIDQEADLQAYIASMARLETANPQTRFVYMTMPLTIRSDQENYQRNVFNDGLRTWVNANKRILFDVADIEAHSPRGALDTFTFNNRTCQKLYKKYTTDGGHLNDKGAEAVALGVYAVSASLLSFEAVRPIAGNTARNIGFLLPIGLVIVGVALAIFARLQTRRIPKKPEMPNG